ncbi:MAG: tetratricopeptide repeat protein, partial [Spirochaeta sp.]|nr:tetratricopeptide repeat protein [Spirochaeta sp.]
MKKKKRKTSSRLPRSVAERHIRPIAAVILDESSDVELVEEAYHDLLRMEGRYVLPAEYYSSRMVAASTLNKDPAEILEIAENGIEHYPNDVFLRFNLGAAYFQYGYPLLAYRELELAKNRHTRKDAEYLQIEQIDELIEDIESEAPKALSTAHLQWPADKEIAADGEQVRRLLELGSMEECVERALDTLKRRPDQNHVRNNLARALWELGRIHDAVLQQEESLQRDPDRFSGLANLVRFCTITNRNDQARKWADHALSLDPPEGPEFFPLVEILAFMDEGSELRTLAEERQDTVKKWPVGPRGTAALLIGAAYARADRMQEARRWWNTARSAGLVQEAQLRLDELDRPANDRNAPWYFSTPGLLPREISGMLSDTEIPEEPEDLVEWVRPTADAFPDFTGFGSYLLRHGDDVGRLISLALLEITDDSEMAREATELIRNNGVRKDRRAQAFQALESYGPVEVPELDDTLHVQGYRISFEPTSSLPESVQDLHTTAHEHLADDEPDQAEPLLLQALDIHDDPSIRQNLAVAY